MSFILDALQRAQKAHDQPTVETAPILADQLPDAPANMHRRIVWLALALLAAASIALAAWWLGRESAAPSSPPAAPTVVATETAAQSAPIPRTDRAPVRALDQEVARAQPARPAATPRASAGTTTSDADIQEAIDAGATLITPRPRPNADGSVRITPDGAAQPRVARNVPAPAAAPVVDESESLPQYENLLRSGQLNLPNLKLDMHVYNQQPAKRFVFLNFKKYREGEKLDGDTVIEEITAAGAVLNHKGQRFLLRPN